MKLRIIFSSSVVAAVFFLLLVPAQRVVAEKPAWQGHIDWAIGDTGAPDCPQEYQYPECLLPGGGNRSCLMRKGIASAKADDCANAMRQALTCQCHNKGAQTQLGAAGQAAVCSYMKSK